MRAGGDSHRPTTDISLLEHPDSGLGGETRESPASVRRVEGPPGVTRVPGRRRGSGYEVGGLDTSVGGGSSPETSTVPTGRKGVHPRDLKYKGLQEGVPGPSAPTGTVGVVPSPDHKLEVSLNPRRF